MRITRIVLLLWLMVVTSACLWAAGTNDRVADSRTPDIVSLFYLFDGRYGVL